MPQARFMRKLHWAQAKRAFDYFCRAVPGYPGTHGRRLVSSNSSPKGVIASRSTIAGAFAVRQLTHSSLRRARRACSFVILMLLYDIRITEVLGTGWHAADMRVV